MFKKKISTRAEKIKARILQFNEDANLAFKKAKEFEEQGNAGKATQETMRGAILVDKAEIFEKKLEELSTKEEGGDKTVEWSEETARLFYNWLRKEDEGYYRFLQLTKANPDVLKVLLQIDLDKPFPKYELVVKG